MRFTPKSGSQSHSNTVEPVGAEEVTHLLILVPGTGPQTEEDKPKGRFVRKARKFREMLRESCRHEFAGSGANIEMETILFHSDLHTLESTKSRMDQVTLPSIPWIRTLDNEIIGDILYYYSAYHGNMILEMIINKLNDAYNAFMQRHPGFAGPINLVAHSLGGLICYEILYMMHMRGVGRSHMVGGEWEKARYRDLPDLAFDPVRLFTMGSPHGGTLVFRNLSFSEFLMGRTGFHNIFHPYDPFGYRTEPLVNEAYADIPAVPITGQRAGSNSNSSSRLSSQSQEGTQNPATRRMRPRKSLGGSMADLGRSFVESMVVAPVTLSSTMLRVAKHTVTAPINVVTSRASTIRSRRASVDSRVSEDGRPANRHMRRRSISRIIPAIGKPFTFKHRFGRARTMSEGGQGRAVPLDSEEGSEGGTASSTVSQGHESRVAARFSMLSASVSVSRSATPAADPENRTPSGAGGRLRSYRMVGGRASSGSVSGSEASDTGSHAEPVGDIPRVQTLGSLETNLSGSSESEGLAGGQLDDMVMNQIMHIFSLSRPPNKEQQLAEAQGLPLSSRVMAHCSQRLHPTLSTSPGISRDKSDMEAFEDRVSVEGSSSRIKRANTLPLTLADSRRLLRSITDHARENPPSPEQEPVSSNQSNVTDSLSFHTPESTPDSGVDRPPPLAEVPRRSATASEAPQNQKELGSPSLEAMPKLPYSERMDYIIPFTKRHLQNEYWLGIHSHFSYWTSRDVVYHILHHIIDKPKP
ncbi:hypothetical protein GGF46_000358 [Coemansia sp. RSA 552]|nr:hypothetical protein GGF46_000358 [Coemansia sp. RSA 552]